MNYEKHVVVLTKILSTTNPPSGTMLPKHTFTKQIELAHRPIPNTSLILKTGEKFYIDALAQVEETGKWLVNYNIEFESYEKDEMEKEIKKSEKNGWKKEKNN